MDKLNKLTSRAVPLPIEDIDTDQIIPARFLKAIDKQGFGENLFRDWRYESGDTPNDNFVLNNPLYEGSILVAGKNFGCGSSREHAAWALYDYGFRVVVSSFFADIFRNNALNNGILPLIITDKQLASIFATIESNNEASFALDMENQTFHNVDRNEMISFEIDAYKKMCLINGYDDIDFLLSNKAEVEAHERAQTIVL